MRWFASILLDGCTCFLLRFPEHISDTREVVHSKDKFGISFTSNEVHCLSQSISYIQKGPSQPTNIELCVFVRTSNLMLKGSTSSLLNSMKIIVFWCKIKKISGTICYALLKRCILTSFIIKSARLCIKSSRTKNGV